MNIDAICGTGKTRGGGSGGSAIGPFKTGGRLFRIFIGIMGIGRVSNMRARWRKWTD